MVVKRWHTIGVVKIRDSMGDLMGDLRDGIEGARIAILAESY